MNLYILSVIIISVLFIPVSFIGADESKYTGTQFGDRFGNASAEDGRIYVFVQVEQRDSNGNLVAFVQSGKMTNINPNTVNYYIDRRDEIMEIPVYDFDGVLVQAYGERFSSIQESYDITASTLLVVELATEEKSQKSVAARFAHDGLVMAPGDIMETHWYIARLLD